MRSEKTDTIFTSGISKLKWYRKLFCNVSKCIHDPSCHHKQISYGQREIKIKLLQRITPSNYYYICQKAYYTLYYEKLLSKSIWLSEFFHKFIFVEGLLEFMHLFIISPYNSLLGLHAKHLFIIPCTLYLTTISDLLLLLLPWLSFHLMLFAQKHFKTV